MNKIYNENVKPFKLNFTLAGIYETTEGNELKYNHFLPRIEYIGRNKPIIINELKDIDTYISYIETVLYEINEFNFERSRDKIISITSIAFKLFKLNKFGSSLKGVFPEELIKSRAIILGSGNLNLCVFECLFHQLYFNEHNKYCNQLHTIISQAKRLCEAEGFDSRRFDGLDIISTVKLFEKHHMNINFFTYDSETKSYSSFAQYCFSNDYISVNLLMLNINDKFHLSYIKNLETLTGYMICPKCKSYCYKKKKHGNDNSLKAFNRHVNNCDGVFRKKINLNKVALPYLPHLFNNKAYLYAYAHMQHLTLKQ